MKITVRTLAFVGALALIPAGALAASKPAQAKAAKVATHSTSGIVRSADATSLVIAKNAKDTKTTTFALNASTVTKGTLTPGTRVDVRFRKEGSDNVATAVTVKAVKAPKAIKSLPKPGN